jgi:hypothetical protein
MQNPFEPDATMPEPPPLEGGTPVYKFPSAVGYETVPEDFKPTPARPVPALRCSHVRDDGTRCKKFGVKGTGFDMPAMCLRHGGSLPPVKAKAEAIVLSARMRLIEALPTALDTLIDLAENASAEAIKLKASTEILDRANVKGGYEITVEVNNGADPSLDILKKLQIMRERAQPQIEDLGEKDETEEDTVEEQAEAPLHVNKNT